MKIKAIKKEYGKRVVLDTEEIELEKGFVYAIMGPNGSGKSSFAKAIALENKLEGDYLIGYMPQKNFVFRMSVLENAMLSTKDEEKARKLLREFGMDTLFDAKAKTLSGGETAKLCLARVLLKHFDLLILDEPSAAMDIESSYISEKEILKYAKEENAAIVLITHSKEQAKRISDYTFIFNQGKIIESGKSSEILNNPKDAISKKFLAL